MKKNYDFRLPMKKMSIPQYGYRKNRRKKPIFGVTDAGRDPPASMSFLAAADLPEISPPFPFSLPSPIFSLTFSNLPLL
jgi:hypothetical protein